MLQGSRKGQNDRFAVGLFLSHDMAINNAKGLGDVGPLRSLGLGPELSSAF